MSIPSCSVPGATTIFENAVCVSEWTLDGDLDNTIVACLKGNLVDSQGNPGAPNYVPGRKSGLQAINFPSLPFLSSGNTMVSICDPKRLLELQTLSVEACVRSKKTSLNGTEYILSKCASTPGGDHPAYALYTGSNTGIYFYVYIGTAGTTVVSPNGRLGINVWDGDWHHIAGVYDGQMTSIYVDGYCQGTSALWSEPILPVHAHFR